MKRLVAIIALALPLAACAVSQQEEVAMGEQYSAQINQQLPIMSDPELNRYINVLGDSLARLLYCFLSRSKPRRLHRLCSQIRCSRSAASRFIR